jgi:hypothetical protein
MIFLFHVSRFDGVDVADDDAPLFDLINLINYEPIKSYLLSSTQDKTSLLLPRRHRRRSLTNDNSAQIARQRPPDERRDDAAHPMAR